MSIEFNIAQGLATIKIEMGEVIAVFKELAGSVKHEEARNAMKSAITEIRRSCDTVVNVFTPLYALTDQANFGKKFGDLHASFKNAYLKDIGAVRTSCTIVKGHLDALLKKKEWLSALPFFDRSYERLSQLCQNWLFSDYALANQMESFLRNMDEYYNQIATLARKDAASAFTTLLSGLEQFQDDLLSLRRQLNSLDIVGRAL